MTPRAQKDGIFTPELIRIIKIFGALSLLIVFGLSFFNTKRANNTGEDRTFKMTDSDRLYFLNVRALSYDREVRKDAQMTLFRHDNREKSPDLPSIDLVIVMSALKDEAYLYVEPVNLDWPIRVKTSGEKEFTLENGNREQHLTNARLLEEFVRNESNFFLFYEGEWVPFWDEPGELSYLKTLFDDYNELVN
ncbi:hypothetical protein [Algoriphagus namhaensis]